MSHAASTGGTGGNPFRKVMIGALVAVVMMVAILAVKNSVPQPAGSIVALVLLVAGIAIGYKAIAGKSGASGGTAHAPAGGHGAHGTEGGVIALCALLFVGGVCFLFAEFTQVKLLNETREERIKHYNTSVVLMPPRAPEPKQRYIVEAPVDREIRIPVRMGMTCDTDLTEPNRSVWVRWEGEERVKDWTGRPSDGTKKHRGSNYVYLQSAETVPVKVEVHIYPAD